MNAPARTFAAFLLAALTATVRGQSSPAPVIELVSMASTGVAANGRSGSSPLISPMPPRTRLSADGRYVVFESDASNLSPNDTNFATDVFVRDRQLGTTTLISVAGDGTPGNGMSLDPVISGDARYVAFVSAATNLVAGDTNGFNDVFLRDLVAHVTTRLSVATNGEQANSVSAAPAINADGRYVAFHSGASTLGPGDTNNTHDVFVRDVVSATTERVSVRTDGAQGVCCASLHPTVTNDGRYVAFVSQSHLDAAHTNSTQEVFVHDRDARTTTLVSLTASGGLSNAGAIYASISADGRFIAWQSPSTNIVTPDQNGFRHDIFLRNLETGGTSLVSVASDGTQGNHDSWMPAISGDGRYVVFHSWANNLVPGDTNTFAVYDVFLRDTKEGTTIRVNAGVGGAEADGTSDSASITTDGRLIYFQSTATNLVAGHSDSHQDVFVYAAPAPANTDPNLHNDVVTATEDLPITIAPLANDSDPDGDVLAMSTFTQGAHGVVTVNGNGELLYTPAANFNGVDSFQYSAHDGRGGSDTASVTLIVVAVNDAPSATPDSYATPHGVDLYVAVTNGVLSNDADIDGDSLTAELVSAPDTQGTVVLAPDGSFTLTPAPGFSGPYIFRYRAVDPASAASAAVNVTVIVGPRPTSTTGVIPVIPARLHPLSSTPRPFMGEPFVVNRRLALIENGTVPCVEVDTYEVTRCLFDLDGELSGSRRFARSSGDWLEDVDGRRFAIVGQPVTRDGTLTAGAFIVGTIPDADGRMTAIGRTSRDSAGIWFIGAGLGQDLAGTCMVQAAATDRNFGGMPLQNAADQIVGTTSAPHPDTQSQGRLPVLVSRDPERGLSWYTGIGAALNDSAGQERDPTGMYFGMDWSCHFVLFGGVGVPAAKRPATRSYPAPGTVKYDTPLQWLPANPYVTIANGSPVDIRPAYPPSPHLTVTFGLTTIYLDATASVGDIIRYEWDLDWTTADPDASSSSPTAEFALPAGPRTGGRVRLQVVARDGQKVWHDWYIQFKRRSIRQAPVKP